MSMSSWLRPRPRTSRRLTTTSAVAAAALALMMGVQDSFAASTVRLGEVTARQGQTVDLDVILESADADLFGLAFALTLPDAVLIRGVEPTDPNCIARLGEFAEGELTMGLACPTAIPVGSIMTLSVEVNILAEAGIDIELPLGSFLGSDGLGVEDLTVLADALIGGITVVPGCAAPGDIFHVDGLPDGLDLRDFMLLRRKAFADTLGLGDETLATDLACADLTLSEVCVTSEGVTVICPSESLDGALDLADVETVRGLFTGSIVADCEAACLSGALGSGADARLPGDVNEDGEVNVLDVVIVLNWAVRAMDPPAAGEDLFILADMEPNTEIEDGVFEVNLVPVEPNINVSDVIIILRAAVGAIDVVWPLRELDITFDDPTPVVAPVGYSVELGNWPAYAAYDPASFSGAGCDAATGSGVDEADGTCTVTCATDPSGLPALDANVLFTFPYRGFRPVDPESLVLGNQVVDGDLNLFTLDSGFGAVAGGGQ